MFQFDIRRLDVYRKVPKDLTQPTRTGAVISVMSVTFCLYLLLAEFSTYMRIEILSEVYVDDPVKSYERIPVFINISLHRVPCNRLALDAQDDMGRHEVGMVSNFVKTPLPLSNGQGQGCNMIGSFEMAKVSGNFHVSTHGADAKLSETELEAQAPVNLAHTIHRLSVGTSATPELRQAFKEVSSFTPLDGRAVPDSEDWDGHEYFLKIVPSIFERITYRMLPFQFTALYKKMPGSRSTGDTRTAIWFRYEMAPIVVKYREHEKPFYHFLTSACAIIGGSFTVAGIIDSLIYSASTVFQKAQLGKLP